MVIAGISEVIVGDLTDWVVSVIDTVSYPGVALLVALESVFPPIPSEIVLPAAGFAAAAGTANVWAMAASATLGSVLGAWGLYLAAAAIGHVRLHALTARYGRWAGVTPQDLARAEAWFDDHSSAAVLVCRCIPLLRSLVSVPAGFRRMHPLTFTLYTAIGSLAWNAVLIGAGFQLGDNWETVTTYVGVAQYVVLAVFATGLGWWVWTRFLSTTHRARRELGAEMEVADIVPDATDR